MKYTTRYLGYCLFFHSLHLQSISPVQTITRLNIPDIFHPNKIRPKDEYAAASKLLDTINIIPVFQYTANTIPILYDTAFADFIIDNIGYDNFVNDTLLPALDAADPNVNHTELAYDMIAEWSVDNLQRISVPSRNINFSANTIYEPFLYDAYLSSLYSAFGGNIDKNTLATHLASLGMTPDQMDVTYLPSGEVVINNAIPSGEVLISLIPNCLTNACKRKYTKRINAAFNYVKDISDIMLTQAQSVMDPVTPATMDAINQALASHYDNTTLSSVRQKQFNTVYETIAPTIFSEARNDKLIEINEAIEASGEVIITDSTRIQAMVNYMIDRADIPLILDPNEMESLRLTWKEFFDRIHDDFEEIKKSPNVCNLFFTIAFREKPPVATLKSIRDGIIAPADALATQAYINTLSPSRHKLIIENPFHPEL